jgi:hypothetical protein
MDDRRPRQQGDDTSSTAWRLRYGASIESLSTPEFGPGEPLQPERLRGPMLLPTGLPALPEVLNTAPTVARAEEDAFELPGQKPKPVIAPIDLMLDKYLSLLAEDDRMQRTLGYGLAIHQNDFLSVSDPENPVAVRDRQEVERRLDRSGRYLFVRPAEKSLKELGIYREARIGIKEFKERELRGNDTKSERGHLTGKLRRGKTGDMLEVAYRYYGMRAGTTLHNLRLSFVREFNEALRFSLYGRIPYRGNEQTTATGDVEYRFDGQRSLHLVGGTEFFTGLMPFLYPYDDSAERAALGTALYLSVRF